MKASAREKLETLRSDYAGVVGNAFHHFFCPILFTDQDVPLCNAHVINEAFVGADRTQTIQRRDVDSFFGSLFESDFEKLQYKGQLSPFELLADEGLSRKLRPRLVSHGEEVEYYRPKGTALPKGHTHFEIGEGDSRVRLGLKLEPSKALERLSGEWHFEVEQDVRLAALASLLKAAHLTLFERVGYTYALSAGGYFLGNNILGRFFRENHALPRSEQLKNAEVHFREYVNLVRPMLGAPKGTSGTITDGVFLFCLNQGRPFAFLVQIATGVDRHAAMVPIFEDVEGAVRFEAFLREPSPTIEVRAGRYKDRIWEVAPDTATISWPKANYDGPIE